MFPDMAVALAKFYISHDSPLVDAPVMESSNRFLDAIEHGLGFPRGYLEEFINSKTNQMSLRADLMEAFKEGKWALVPDEDHLRYIVCLWASNRRRAVDERDRYLLPEGQKSDSGLIQYPYRLFHVKNIRIFGPEETAIDSGATQVWSTIPPYFHMIFAKNFMLRHSRDVPLTYVYYKARLSSIDVYMGLLIPRGFVTPLPHTDRPTPWCLEDQEELEKSWERKQAMKMMKALERYLGDDKST